MTVSPSRAAVVARLRALSVPAAGFRYPDTDNQMEDGVFSFAKRTDEARVWGELLARVPAGAGRALDAGCGLGAHAAALAARFEDPLLLDADAGRARQAAARTGWPFLERVFVARVDDGALLHPELRGAFSFVQMIQVLGHLPVRAVGDALGAMHHLLDERGHLLLAVPFSGTPRDLTFVTALAGDGRVRPRAVSLADYDALARCPEEGKLPVRHFSMTSLLSALTTGGFELVEAKPYHWFSHDTGDLFALARRRA